MADDLSDFQKMLEELADAADAIGGHDLLDELGAQRSPSKGVSSTLLGDEADGEVKELREAARSLLDLRGLTLDEPLSRQFTQPIDVEPEVDIGSVVDGKYELVAQAPRAAGWEARHIMLRQRYRVQFLARSIVDDPLLWPKFQQDIGAAGLLGHENIEFVTDLGRCERHGAYIAKQWLVGESFTEWMQHAEHVENSDVLAFGHSLCSALAALHEIGVIHGRLSPETVRRVVTDSGRAVWKVLDVCIPGGGGSEQLVAPEQTRGEATGPEADQYAIAYLVWKMLYGIDAPVDEGPPGASDALVEVLQRALHDTPLMRWPDLEAFASELAQVMPTEPRPTVAPFDRAEASRVVQNELAQLSAAVEHVAPDNPFEARPSSMVIRVDSLDGRAGVNIDFASSGRLRREYRRNMLLGGLFVPTAHDLAVGSTIQARISFSPQDVFVDSTARVVSFDPGGADRPRGYGVAFDGASRGKLEQFVKSLGIGLGMQGGEELEVLKPLDASANLDTGAAFLLSRLSGKMTVSAARAMSAGLPYDFDDSLTALIDGGFVGLRPSSPKPAPIPRAAPAASKPAPRASPPPGRPQPQPASRPPPTPPAVSATKPVSIARSFAGDEWTDVARVLETVTFFEKQGNYMAAGRVLTGAVEHQPNIGAFQHRLAMLRAQFDVDLVAARAAVRRAIELEPRNGEFRAGERFIATLVEMAGVRVVWDRGTSPLAWLRTEPELGFVWLAGPRSIIRVSVRHGSLEQTSCGPGQQPVAANSPEFDAIERRKPAQTNSHRERRARQIKLSRRFGHFGPHCVKAPAPTAISSNGTVTADTRSGLRVVSRGTELSTLSMSTHITNVAFSPNEQSIAWIEKLSSGFGLYVAPITGPAKCREMFEKPPSFHWSDDSSSVIALDSGGKVRAFDRGADRARTVLELPKATTGLTLVRGVDDDSFMVVGRHVVGGTRWLGVWVEEKTGKVRGEYTMPDRIAGGVIRSDGKLAVVLSSGALVVADVHRGEMKTLSSVEASVGCLHGSHWGTGMSLLIVDNADGKSRVLSVDVDLLCG